MVRFEDIFWSNDYCTGINSLLSNLNEGQTQAQEVLNYFQSTTELIDQQSTKFYEIAQRQFKYLDSIKSTVKKDRISIASLICDKDASVESIDDVVKAQADGMKKLSLNEQKIRSEIESNVVIVLTDFIDDFRTFQNDTKRDLNASLKDYNKSIQRVTALKARFESKARALEDISTSPNATEKAPLLPGKNNLPNIPQPSSGEYSSDDNEDSAFEFPLRIGEVIVESVGEMSNLLAGMIEEIPVKRRLIPLPGINNEYFRSEDFGTWVKSYFPKEDTTNKIERLGQDLIDLGLISNWNKLSKNQFVYESGYFYEFTDLARYSAKFDENIEKEEVNLNLQTQHNAIAVSNTTTQQVWNGLKSKFTTSTDIHLFKEHLDQLRSSYFESVNQGMDLKLDLESKISFSSKRAAVFQSNRIALIHRLNSLFNEKVIEQQSSYLSQLQAIQQLINKRDPESLEVELLSTIVGKESGWYWPKSDIKFVDYSNRSTTIGLFDTDLVNLDVDESQSDYKFKSTPLFVYRMVQRLNQEDNVGPCWTSDLDLSIAYKIKKAILQHLFNISSSSEAIDVKIRSVVDLLFKRFETPEIINFLKLWFLELPDSILPFTVYDSLLHLYEKDDESDARIHIIGSIPRQNLATLLFLVSHLQSALTSPEEELALYGCVPLTNILIRPSTTKTSFLNITDSWTLHKLLKDLLDKRFQDALYKKLECLEEYHIEKMKRAENSIKAYKAHQRNPSELASLQSVATTSMPPSRATHLTPEGLKPFKTKSPSSSSAVDSPVRSRSNSTNLGLKSNLLSSNLKRPSENLGKRNSRAVEANTSEVSSEDKEKPEKPLDSPNDNSEDIQSGFNENLAHEDI